MGCFVKSDGGIKKFQVLCYDLCLSRRGYFTHEYTLPFYKYMRSILTSSSLITSLLTSLRWEYEIVINL